LTCLPLPEMLARKLRAVRSDGRQVVKWHNRNPCLRPLLIFSAVLQVVPPRVEQVVPPRVEQVVPPRCEQVVPPQVEQVVPPRVEQVVPPQVEQLSQCEQAVPPLFSRSLRILQA
jgi:hypothetical protein